MFRSASPSACDHTDPSPNNKPNGVGNINGHRSNPKCNHGLGKRININRSININRNNHGNCSL